MNALSTVKALACALGILLALGISLRGQDIKTPEDHFGFTPGADGMLFNYDPLISYLKELEGQSGRIRLEEIGKTPMGKSMYLAFISSEENIARLEDLKAINRELALNPSLDDGQRQQMIERGRVFFLATLSMHSSEVGPTQSVPLIVYDLLTTDDPVKLSWLEKVVYMITPSHNPDGMDLVVDHFNKYKGTKYEGSSLPGVYHKYVGHDNNRDFVALTQEDTRAVSRIITEWHPQVTCEKHQMGSRGVRYFVPPPHDPIAENIDAGIWNWIGIFGSNMMKDMTRDSLAGVAQHYLFDEYWPGSTETSLWKNVIGFLTEAASVQTAKPIYIEPNELAVWGKGLSEYEKSINMPLPWEGGWWRLSDIVEYEIATTMSIIKTAATHDKDILRFRNDLARSEVNKGKTQAPYYYIMPSEQHDPGELLRLVRLLQEHGIKVNMLSEDFASGKVHFNAGDIIVPMDQAYRPFIKEVMEKQVFPLRHYTPDGEIIRPYDITSWSLPLHNGVCSFEINTAPLTKPVMKELSAPYDPDRLIPDDHSVLVFPAEWNESYRAAFMMSGQGIRIERSTGDISVGEKKVTAGSFIVYPGKKKDKLQELLDSLSITPLAFTEDVAIEGTPLKIPKIGLVESFNHDMDAGWTRYLFDEYGIPFKVLVPADFETTDLSKEFDVIVFPDNSKSILMEGKYKSSSGDYYVSSYPPEIAKGMGKKGFEKLLMFADDGGIIISWGESTELFMGTLSLRTGEEDEESFSLPIKDISGEAKGLYCPGSWLGANFVQGHPITRGMPADGGVFSNGKPFFLTSVPQFDTDRRVLATYVKDDPLISGYIEKGELLEGKTILAWLRKGKGQFVLFGFSPQFRASTAATYKLLFNSLLLPGITE